MRLDIQQLILLGILCASVHWLIARSSVFEPLWSRATGKIDKLLRCPMCSGFWLGLAAGAAGIRPVTTPDGWPLWITLLITGLVAVFTTPVFEGALMWGLERSDLSEDAELVARTTDAIAELEQRPTPPAPPR